MSRRLFARQFAVLCTKNAIVLSKYPFLNTLRCFVLPIAYGIFLAVAQLFLSKPNNFGIGAPVPVKSLSSQFNGALPIWWADGTNGTGSPSPADVMDRLSSGFSTRQRNGIRKADSPDDIPSHCPQNFNGFSECFAAVVFNTMPTSLDDPSPVNYTLRADDGFFHIDVKRHTSDFEKRVLPLQWAVDQALISLRTGTNVSTPLEWPFTQETNTEQFTKMRLSYIRGIRTLLVLALFICYIGIAYQLPGAFGGERANMLSSHLKAMGLFDSARIISWHTSISLAYLPAWVIVALIWHFRIFTGTHVLLVLAVHILFGLSLASWSLFIAAPFGKSPQLAAVASTFLSIVLAILALLLKHAGDGTAFIFSIVFPPGYYVFATRAICGWENEQIPTNALKPDPDTGLRLLPIMLAALIDVFLWPYLAVLLERRLYDAREPAHGPRRWWACGTRSRRRPRVQAETGEAGVPDGTAISIRHLNKTYPKARIFGRNKTDVTAVADLSLDVPKHGIFVLLGANGAGKSTTLSVLANLQGRSSGSVLFEGGLTRPPRGTMGIVPQKNVLFPELTCLQNMRVWRAVKQARPEDGEEGGDAELERLLKDCDLAQKIHANASTLSGGQKRKLQLAIGLVGGSKIVLVDEATSGVDPLSRRSLWRTLTSVRHNRTIVFTTHFLDEADLLADNIAILAAPGTLVAHGTPVSLKRSLGEGYSVQVTMNAEASQAERVTVTGRILDRLRTVSPLVYCKSPTPYQCEYHLKSKDSTAVEHALQILEEERATDGIESYDVHGTSVEDIFLGLMGHSADDSEPSLEKTTEKTEEDSVESLPSHELKLTTGRSQSPYRQAFIIFHKRWMIARRSWLTPLLAVLIGICGACIPVFFIRGRAETCVRRFLDAPLLPLFFPESPVGFALGSNGTGSTILASPPGVIAAGLGASGALLNVTDENDNSAFVNTIQGDFRNLMYGGVSLNFTTDQTLFAWEATPPGNTGLVMLNLASNLLYNHALGQKGAPGNGSSIIAANFQTFPPVNAGTLVALKWVAFYGAAMAVFPAFFSLYVSKERRSSVQAMQLSNGLSDPIGLWLGHLMFDSLFCIFAATIIIIVFATASNQFFGLGFFWVILVLYGIVGTLFAYCVSLFVASPLAAFAAVAGYQIVMYILYLAAYLLILTYAKTSAAGREMTIIHFTLSIASPVASAMRAAFVSVNLFSLLCAGNDAITTSSLGTLKRYGGPILYLIVYGLVLFSFLVWMDSGSMLPRHLLRRRKTSAVATRDVPRPDVKAEAEAVGESTDALRVLNVSKTYGSMKVVDDVSMGVSQGTVFSLLGPNGAGKTTTFNMIRGDVVPDEGDILIEGTSVIRHPRAARLALGVCPQFTAIDSQLTVSEHLYVYGRLKGLRRGTEVQQNIDALLRTTGLDLYADRLASKLSGGNQRKLALAIALMGNPSVVLIDEFSSGVDAKMKREMWTTLRGVAAGKAVVITTHSMEEAAALANKVGILAKRMLAVGTTDALVARYATYEVHFSCRTPEDVARVGKLMARVPGARPADDVATRYEVPIRTGRFVDERNDGEGVTLPALFKLLAEESQQDAAMEYAVERPSLESVFLKVIREANVLEEDRPAERRRRWIFF